VHDKPRQAAVNDGDAGRGNPGTDIARRRTVNRECMRRRRADPTHAARDKERRKDRQHSTRLRAICISANVAQPMGRVCAICHLRAAVEEIARLELSDTARGGYVQVWLPYCGRC
jgi:hypothetical protein